MVWLATHIWMLLAGAALAGLLLGIGLRGLLLGSKLRRSLVERDVALTELDQARAEIDGLYASQRQVRDGVPHGDGDVRAELSEWEARVASLTDELAGAHAEIETLRESQATRDGGSGTGGSVSAGMAAAAGAIAGGAAAIAQQSGDRDQPMDAAVDPEESSLAWRNRYLESQIRRLQAELETASQAAPAPVAEAPVPVPLPSADGPNPTDIAKMRWQNNYLQTRVKVLEDRVVAASMIQAAPLIEEIDEDRAAAPSDLADQTTRTETTDEELARLRWRNRYLEGRLAYLEENADGEASPEAAAAVAVVRAAGSAAGLSAGPDVEEPPEAEPDSDLGPEPEPDQNPPLELPLAADSEAEHPDQPELPTADADGAESDTTDTAPIEATPSYAPAFSDEQPAETVAPPESSDAATEVAAVADDPDIDTGPMETVTEGDPLAPHDTQAPEDNGDDQIPVPEAAPDLEADAEPDPAADEPVAQSEPGITAEKPPAIAKPRDGADDLTAIGGIGPRIQDVLHGLGIYKYSQIAEWTPANEVWIDEYLSFSGRVGRERWVDQASSLTATPPDEPADGDQP